MWPDRNSRAISGSPSSLVNLQGHGAFVTSLMLVTKELAQYILPSATTIAWRQTMVEAVSLAHLENSTILLTGKYGSFAVQKQGLILRRLCSLILYTKCNHCIADPHLENNRTSLFSLRLSGGEG